MARRFEMTDEQWTRIEYRLPGRSETPGATAKDNRLFIDAGAHDMVCKSKGVDVILPIEVPGFRSI